MSSWYRSILVSVTEGCNVGCGHCGFLGSTRERETAAQDIAEWVRQACEFGIATMIFTGGEPFERQEVLAAGVASARRCGTPSAVFTSSFWGTSLAAARETLARFEGLEHLYLSSDVYHQKRVPLERVHHVIDAARSLGIPKISIVITYASETDRLEVRSWYARHGDSLRFCEERVIPTPYIGKALRGQDALLPARPDAYEPHCWLDTPIINPNGDLFACHVGKAGAHASLEEIPYWLGNLRRSSFAEIMAASRSRADYQFLRTHGPRGVAELFAAYPDLEETIGRSGFTGPCDMCFSALSHPAGAAALREYAATPAVVARTNVRLALELGEPPMPARKVEVPA